MATGLYFAGKIAMHDWRHGLGDIAHYGGGIVPKDFGPARTCLGDSIGEEITYVGPFFAGCDHGCAHGSSGHGQVGGCNSGDRNVTAARCLEQVASADLVFAWLDELKPDSTQSTAYGTLVEVGYALGLGKPVVVASAHAPYGPDSGHHQVDRHTVDDLWFAWTLASARIVAPTPEAALKVVVDDLTYYTLMGKA